MRPAGYSYLGHYSARWSRRSRWGSSGGCSASPAPGGSQRLGSCHTEVTRSPVSSSQRSTSHCELTLLRPRRPDYNWQLLRNLEPSVRQIPRPRGCRRFAAPSLVTHQTPGWRWRRLATGEAHHVMRTQASMLHDSPRLPWWSQTIRWCPSWTISRHLFWIQSDFWSQEKTYLMCPEKTIWYNQTHTDRHEPNHSLSTQKLSYSDHQLKYSVGSLESHRLCYFKQKSRLLGNQKLELDKIWASSRLCG